MFYLAITEFTAILDPPQDVFRRLHELRLHETKFGPAGESGRSGTLSLTDSHLILHSYFDLLFSVPWSL